MAKAKGNYVDGFVFPVPKKKLPAYKKMATEAGRVWKRFGAVAYYECMGDDLTTKASHGMPAPLSFVKLAKQKSGETVWFSFIVFKSRAHRDVVNKKVMDYFNKKYVNQKDAPDMPFDVRKMAYGGFRVIVNV